MKEPNKIPLDPSTPKAKDVKKYPLTRYPEAMEDDIYIKPDNDSVYTPIDLDLDKINKTLDKASYEDPENSN